MKSPNPGRFRSERFKGIRMHGTNPDAVAPSATPYMEEIPCWDKRTMKAVTVRSFCESHRCVLNSYVR